jgi:hypothetical protein
MLIDFTSDELRKYSNSQINKFGSGYNYESYLNNIPAEANGVIRTLITNLELLLGVSEEGKLDYAHQIKKLDDIKKQRECWIIRLQIFICILLDVVNNLKSGNENIDLKTYKLGIFGSDNPTSDIDIGIQYTALDKSNLSKLVQIIEDKFVFFGYRTLDFDIEFYGDLLTITKLTNNLPVEYLYLSNSKFECNEFIKLLSYCGASIYRNYLHRTLKNQDMSKARTEFTNLFLGYCEKYIQKLMDTDKLESFDVATQNLLFQLLRTCVTNTRFANLFSDVEAYMYLVDEKVIGDTLVKFNRQRQEYYKRIAKIENSINNRQDLVGINNKLSNDKILSLIQHIGNALIYRDESYVCVPTIMHVVRIMQAKSNNAIRQMGDYGYLISILEQFGYLFRFEDNEAKFEKYNQRLIDALNNIKISENFENCISNLAGVNNKLSPSRTLKRLRNRTSHNSVRQSGASHNSVRRRTSENNV